ncbi:MAG: putative molybdenum carrier protein [Desulfobacterales bacterium]|nr:putative molybdenum carrier protein [Desulfobacterales bacterium]
MIRKIISGGQTGADQAALDAAIKLDIPHGGRVPKGRLTETGPLPDKYHLLEMPSSSYPQRTEQNVIDSGGTLIISHGPLTDGSDYTRKMAIQHQRPWLHIDLNQTPAFKAATQIRSWLDDNRIEVLNVAGPRASKDKKIYMAVFNLIESVYYLQMMNSAQNDAANYQRGAPEVANKPKTIEEAIQLLIGKLPLKEKITIANMTEDELINLNANVGKYILDQFGLWSGNEELVESCLAHADYPLHNEDDAAAVIIKQLWLRLSQTHRLRIIK